MKFSMTCSCGDVMESEGADRAAAVAKLQGDMNQAAVDKHMADKHPGQSMLMADVHKEIAEKLQPVA